MFKSCLIFIILYAWMGEGRGCNRKWVWILVASRRRGRDLDVGINVWDGREWKGRPCMNASSRIGWLVVNWWLFVKIFVVPFASWWWWWWRLVVKLWSDREFLYVSWMAAMCVCGWMCETDVNGWRVCVCVCAKFIIYTWYIYVYSGTVPQFLYLNEWGCVCVCMLVSVELSN